MAKQHQQGNLAMTSTTPFKVHYTFQYPISTSNRPKSQSVTLSIDRRSRELLYHPSSFTYCYFLPKRFVANTSSQSSQHWMIVVIENLAIYYHQYSSFPYSIFCLLRNFLFVLAKWLLCFNFLLKWKWSQTIHKYFPIYTPLQTTTLVYTGYTELHSRSCETWTQFIPIYTKGNNCQVWLSQRKNGPMRNGGHAVTFVRYELAGLSQPLMLWFVYNPNWTFLYTLLSPKSEVSHYAMCFTWFRHL